MKKFLVVSVIAITAITFTVCKKSEEVTPPNSFDYSKLQDGEDKDFTIACMKECRDKGKSTACNAEKIYGMKKDYYSPGTEEIHHLAFIEEAMKLCPSTAEKRLDMSRPAFNASDLDKFYAAISSGDSAAVLKFLKEKKASAVFNPGEYPCPVDAAARDGRLDILKLLVQEGGRLKPQENDTFTCSPLFSAVSGGHIHILEYLIQQGVPLSEKEGFGETALHIAAREGHAEVVSFLLSKGMDPDVKDTNGKTALDYAKLHEKNNVVNILMQKTGK